MNGRKLINVVLKSDVVALKDVVVVGYGVQKKVNPTELFLLNGRIEGKTYY